MKVPAQPTKVLYEIKPDNLSIEEWQIALRRQYADMKSFEVKNTGSRDVFSDYSVYNPETGTMHKVAIRSKHEKINFCDCLDFKTNGLGTCKHIEYIIKQIEGHAITRKIFESNYLPHYTSVYLDYRADRKVKIRIGTQDADAFNALAKNYFDNNNCLNENCFSSFDTFLREAAKINSDFRCYEDALTFIITKREDALRQKSIDEKLSNNNRYYSSLLKLPLLPYQEEGVTFAAKAGRSINADDMGLGKPLQAIATAETLRDICDIKRVLIVCPTSLKYQWKSEIEKHTHSSCTIAEDTKSNRETQYNRSDSFYTVVSYNMAIRDLMLINEARFDMLIVDEAQRIKNWQTITAKSIKKIRTRYCLILMGLPPENNFTSLYSIIQIVDPLLLGPLFRLVQYQKPIHPHSYHTPATDNIQIDKEPMLPANIIRRQRHEVQNELPQRSDKNLYVPLAPKQLSVYRANELGLIQYVKKWQQHSKLSEQDRQKMLAHFNALHMVCNSTFMIDGHSRDDTKPDEILSIVEGVMAGPQGKMVIYTHWDLMAGLISQELSAHGIRHERMSDSLSKDLRNAVLSNFNSDESQRIIIVTDSTNTQLDLPNVTVIVNLDIPYSINIFNNRLSTVLQHSRQKNVQVINIIAGGTIEQRVFDSFAKLSETRPGINDSGNSVVFSDNSSFDSYMHALAGLFNVADTPDVIADIDAEKKVMAPGEKTLSNQALLSEQIETESSDTELKNSTTQLTLFPPGEDADNTLDSGSLQTIGNLFLNKLIETISNEELCNNMMNDLIQTEPATGKCHIRIPVKSREEAIEGLKALINLISKL